LLAYLTITLVLNLPLFFCAGYLRPHVYGLSNLTVGAWFVGVVKTILFTPQFPPAQIPGFLLGFPFILFLYWLLEKSPRRWWLYTGFALVPFFFVGSWIEPIWLDPILHHYGPVKDQQTEAQILDLTRRARMEGVQVIEVEMSRETKSMGAVVVGQGASRRIVLWDTLITGMEERELLTVVAHEIGHYVLGHGKYRLMVHALVLLLALGFVQWTGQPIIKVASDKLGFDRLSDIASLPLVLLLINLALLLLMPIDLAFQRYQEHEADRFAVELTRDNYAAATAYIKLSQGVLNMPKPGPLYTIWRLTHPSEADEVRFFNEYRPWQNGQAVRYGDFIH
jgi:Zn-dependent protease with chaperone function